MPPFAALVHTENDALRLGRTLEMLVPCSEILIVDHHSSDGTLSVARTYGACVVFSNDANDQGILNIPQHDWVLCMQAGESITEKLQASLYEFRLLDATQVHPSYSISLREQLTNESWHVLPPQTRLVPRRWIKWQGNLPISDPSASQLEGEILRFSLP